MLTLEKKMPIISLTDFELESCKRLESGAEGIIRNYLNVYAIKTYYFSDCLSKMKIKKLQALSSLEDPSFCFPIGLVETCSLTEQKISGLYTKIVNQHPEYKDLSELYFLNRKRIKGYLEKTLTYLVKADQAMKRFHEKGGIIGDIHGANIMIDNTDNPIFVDTDNFAYGEFDFSFTPWRSQLLANTFGGSPSRIDCDIYALSELALRMLISAIKEPNYPKEIYEEIIKSLNVNQEAKDFLGLIFSDAPNKPYISEILPKIDFHQQLLTPKLEEKLKNYKK